MSPRTSALFETRFAELLDRGELDGMSEAEMSERLLQELHLDRRFFEDVLDAAMVSDLPRYIKKIAEEAFDEVSAEIIAEGVERDVSDPSRLVRLGDTLMPFARAREELLARRKAESENE